jgi:hypothetical protein
VGWYKSVAHVATWRDINDVDNPRTAWPDRHNPPAAIQQAVHNAGAASVDVRSRLAATQRTTTASPASHAPGRRSSEDRVR